MKAKILFFEIFVTRGQSGRLAWRIGIGAMWMRWLFNRFDAGFGNNSVRII